MITATANQQAAHNLSIQRGGFVYEYCGDYFWVPASAIAVAEESGMVLVTD